MVDRFDGMSRMLKKKLLAMLPPIDGSDPMRTIAQALRTAHDEGARAGRRVALEEAATLARNMDVVYGRIDPWQMRAAIARSIEALMEKDDGNG